jgi:dTDP-4-amino-4,6-dideoxygalactose transaminase
MTKPSMYRVPCCWPLLPTEESVRPYLKEIDAKRWYSNFGPLWARLHGQLAGHFSLDPNQVALVANGTLGLALALMTRTSSAKGLCVMPAWTFVATAHAARLADLTPFFVDVDPVSWALTPQIAEAALKKNDRPIAAVMPVCPFGSPVNLEEWADFERDTGVPVVVDAAAAFDSIQPGSVPALISLHATKAFGVGEGGLLLCTDANLIRDVTRRSNFGFYDSREVEVPSLNAKFSEYHAAVGLAALTQWPHTRELIQSACDGYLGELGQEPGVSFLPGFGKKWIAATCAVAIEGDRLEDVIQTLGKQGIESRKWWREGCHREKAFTDCPCADLPVTEVLAKKALSLPLFPGIRQDDIRDVCRSVIENLKNFPQNG